MRKILEKIMENEGLSMIILTDGSKYRHTTIYTRREGGWEKSFSISAEVESFCDKCGNFIHNCDCGGYPLLTTEEVAVDVEDIYSYSETEIEFVYS